MLMAVNIGNSRICIGIFEKSSETLITRAQIATDLHKSSDEYSILISSLLRERGVDCNGIEDGIVSSVKFNGIPFSEYTIVIPDSNSNEFTKALNEFRASFLEEFSVTITMLKESTYKTIHSGSMDGKKIVVGTLKNLPTSQSIFDTLDYNSFTIRMVDGSIYIIGCTLESTLRAIEYFTQEYMLKADSSTIKFEEGIIYETSAAFPIGNITIGGNHIAKYSIVYSPFSVIR